ncbi:kinase-associated lipoprotein B [Metabacillus fastidiosus]|uniref:kinase-associated lipoprotein B n=1 Tax=Metabacillus fastidiosus TaxID=1458 RepID=UPI00399C5E8B
MEEQQIGDIVTAHYRTGKYIGEVTAVNPAHYVVQIKAVLKHPEQGDLHSPKEVDVPFFHERRALAFNERANIVKQMVKLYAGAIPNYKDSLTDSLGTLREELQRNGDTWSNRSLENLKQLEIEYNR